MRRPGGASAELWVSDIHRLFGVEIRATQEYWSKEHRIVRPTITASARGGRHVYGPREVVMLLTAKQLAEDGLKLDEVHKVINWMESSPVQMVMYPHDPADPKRHEGKGEFRRLTGSPRTAQMNRWQTATFDPFPGPEIAEAYFGPRRGYPRLPKVMKGWTDYWRSMAQFVFVDRYRANLPSIQVLIPVRWLHAEYGRFRHILRWFNRITGELAFEPVLRDGHTQLSTIRMIDVAMVKRHVAEKLLGMPGTEEEATGE